MNFEFTVWHFLFLFVVGGCTGFIDSIAGGGGLVSLPVLLALGLPPQMAIATNKMQSVFGTLSAVYHYRKAHLVRIRQVVWGIVFTALGSVLGANLIQLINNQILKLIVPWLLLGIFIFTLLSPKLGESDKHHRLKAQTFYVVFGLLLGFYDGFFGPGTGAFWAMAFVTLLGFNLRKATAHTKVMNVTSNIVSVITFLYAGLIVIPIGLIMAAGQLVGTYAGTHLVINKGTGFIRIFFLCVVGAMLIKLFWTAYF